MKPAVALFMGVFASGLALAGYMKPTVHKVSCRSYYNFYSSEAAALPNDSVIGPILPGLIQIEGPTLEDRDSNSLHAESLFDENLNITLKFHWDEASTFRDLISEVHATQDGRNFFASASGKLTTAVHLEGLSIRPKRSIRLPIKFRDQTLSVRADTLESVSFFCGITDLKR